MDTRNQVMHNIRLVRLQELNRYSWATASLRLGIRLLNGYQAHGLRRMKYLLTRTMCMATQIQARLGCNVESFKLITYPDRGHQAYLAHVGDYIGQ